MKFKIKNKYVLGLASWLNELRLQGGFSRARTKFVEQLSSKYRKLELERIEIVKKHAKKDKKGELTLKDGRPEILDTKAFNEDIEKLFSTECVVSVPDKDFTLLKRTVLSTDYMFGPQDTDNQQERKAKLRQASDYDIWCEAFESVDN